MKRTFNPGRGPRVSLKSYLARRGITLENIIKTRKLKTVTEVKHFLNSINVNTEEIPDKQVKKLLKKSQSEPNTVDDLILTNTTPKKKTKIKKRTQSKKLTNIVDESKKTKNDIPKATNTE